MWKLALIGFIGVITRQMQFLAHNPSTIEVYGSPSFSTEILPIIEATCSIEDCHDGVQPPDLRSYKKIAKKADVIRERLLDERYPMPPRDVPDIPLLTEEELQLILNWIDHGALEN